MTSSSTHLKLDSQQLFHFHFLRRNFCKPLLRCLPTRKTFVCCCFSSMLVSQFLREIHWNGNEFISSSPGLIEEEKNTTIDSHTYRFFPSPYTLPLPNKSRALFSYHSETKSCCCWAWAWCWLWMVKMKMKSYTKSENGEEEETKLRSHILLLNFASLRGDYVVS